MERIFARVRKAEAGACWDWVITETARQGLYRPYVWCDGRSVSAIRIILENKLGRRLRDGMLTCHTCDNHLCCNPSHLYEGTSSDNVRDMMTRGLHRAGAEGRRQVVDRLIGKIEVRTDGECWPWIGHCQATGHGHLKVFGKITIASRLMLEIALERPLERGEVCRHTCDTRACCNPAHLVAGTQRENLQDARERRRVASGHRHHNARLTPEQVVEMRRQYAETFKGVTALSEEYGVCIRSAGRILNGTDRKYDGGPLKTKGKWKGAKIGPAQAEEIRMLCASGIHSQREVGLLYGVSRSLVELISQGKRRNYQKEKQ